MRISNILHFTENHRFYMYRDFSLSPLEYKMLQWIYQPMTGPTAISLFLLLYEQVPAERIGYSRLEQQRRLFLSLALEPSEKGRKQLIDSASKLEALGLLQTSRQYISEQDEYIYAYRLHKPLNPYEFFKNDHLLLLLRDKIGKHAVLALHDELCCTADYPWNTDSMQQEDISTPFYELFQLNTNIVDFELEQALLESAPGAAPLDSQQSEHTLDYGEMMRRFPRTSANRVWVERLKYAPELLNKLHYLTMKYQLSISRLCGMLDEDYAFNAKGELQYEALEHAAHLIFRQMKKRDDDRTVWLSRAGGEKETEGDARPKEVEMQYYVEVPSGVIEQLDVHQYNAMLKNQPYTKILDLFFPGSVPDSILNTFAKIDLNYKLKEEVINVLIHYIKINDFSWSKPYVDAIASDLLGRQVDSFEKAVEYIRNQGNRSKQQKVSGTKSSGKRNSHQKPKLEVYKGQPSNAFDEDAYLKGLQLAKLLDEKNKR